MSDSEEQQHHQSTLPAPAAAAALSAVKNAILKSQSPPTDPSTATTPSDSLSEEPQTIEAGLIDPNQDLTVFDSVTAFTVRHPLYARWQLWFDSASKQDKAKSWDEALVKVISFDSVEEFWGLYNNIVPPSMIHPNSNYYLFKEGIKPAWEDAANSKGGKWSVQLPRGKYTETIDNYWLYTMLAAIGETFETPFTPSTSTSTSTTPSDSDSLPTAFSDEVTGVIVSARKAFFRINIWTRSSTSPSPPPNSNIEEIKSRLENIGKHFKYGVLTFDQEKGLKISERDKVSSDVEFVSHKDSTAKYGVKVVKLLV